MAPAAAEKAARRTIKAERNQAFRFGENRQYVQRQILIDIKLNGITNLFVQLRSTGSCATSANYDRKTSQQCAPGKVIRGR